MCNNEIPFHDHLGNIYIEIDSVSMGSLLGPIFSDFYMSYLYNKIFNNIKKRSIYLRYVDIFIRSNDINEISILPDAFQKIKFLTLLMNYTKIIKNYF